MSGQGQSTDKNIHIFSIADKIDPDTEKPFGDAYAGSFTVRRPTIKDNREIAVREIAGTSNFGIVNPAHVAEDIRSLSFVFAMVGVCGTDIPDWFDDSKLYDEDVPAIMAVFKEVSRWLKTFQSK